MNQSTVFEEVFDLDVSPETLKQWLTSYYMSQHPLTEPSVWDTYSEGKLHLSYHAPPDGRITFTATVIAPEKLTLVGIYCYHGWEDYCRALIQAIKLRWSSRYAIPEFKFLVNNADLTRVLEVRWEESERTFRAGAYLSTLVLLGSVLEGVLLAKAQQNLRQAEAARSAPKDRKSGGLMPLERWRLDDLIRVAHECGWIDKDVQEFSSTLREYRNLIHPREQAKQTIYPDEGTCKIAREVVGAAFDDLSRGSS